MDKENVLLLSIIVPCFNEQESLSILYERTVAVARKVCGESFELILVNDGSVDTTWPMISELSDKDQCVVGVDLARNFGHQLALTAGLTFARGNRVLVLDADLQDPPELLGDMMALMDKGAEVVYGQRISRKGETKFKSITASLFYRILNRMSDVDIPLDAGDFRLMDRKVVDAILSMPEQSRFIRGMVSWVGYRQVALQYERQERFAGVTKYPLSKMVKFARDAIVGFSLKPLRITIYLALIMVLLALFLFIYVIGAWIADDTVPGWTSLLGSQLLSNGIQLFCIGILGEYIAHIFLEVKRRPLFLVRQLRRRED